MPPQTLPLPMSIMGQQMIRSDFSVERLYNMIGYTYKREVERKGCSFQKTELIREQIMKITKAIVGGQRCGLFMAGQVGNGKTTICKVLSQIINHLVTNGYFGYGDKHPLDYCSALNAMEMVRIYMYLPGEFEDIKHRSWLIIDDLCNEPKEVTVYGTVCYPFLELLFYRYEHQLPTILVSNFNYSDVKNYYSDARAADRLEQMFYKITFRNKSFRQGQEQ